MNDTRIYLEGIFNGKIPVKRKNKQTGAMENIYYKYDDDLEDLIEIDRPSSSFMVWIKKTKVFIHSKLINIKIYLVNIFPKHKNSIQLWRIRQHQCKILPVKMFRLPKITPILIPLNL